MIGYKILSIDQRNHLTKQVRIQYHQASAWFSNIYYHDNTYMFRDNIMNSGEKHSKQRLDSAKAILAECFWEDYNVTAQDILRRIDSGEPGFDRFLFSKIIENSRHPSRYLRYIFTPDHLESLLNRYLKHSGNKKRIRMVAANLTGDYRLASEYGWTR